MSALKWWTDDELQRLGESMIDEVQDHHPLRSLPGCNGRPVLFHYVDDMTRTDRFTGDTTIVAGRASLIPGKWRELLRGRFHFAVAISHEWFTCQAADVKAAVLDHELSHCRVYVDKVGEACPMIAGHDLEEFNDVMRRRGAWRPEIKNAVPVFQQLDLFGGQSLGDIRKMSDQELTERARNWHRHLKAVPLPAPGLTVIHGGLDCHECGFHLADPNAELCPKCGAELSSRVGPSADAEAGS